MINKVFALGLLILMLLSACKQDGSTGTSDPNGTNATTLQGFWVPIDFCTRAYKEGSILKAMNNSSKPYSYALAFDSSNPDSVTCFNGTETWKLHVKYRKDTLELEKAHGDLSVYLVYDPKDNKDLTMFNGTSGKTEMNRFILSKAQVMNGYTAFQVALNNSMLFGSFEALGKGTDPVRFIPNGSITGLKDYDRFELCTGGDCVLMTDMDVITLGNSKKPDADQMYGYRFSEKKDTFFVYNLINQNPAEKGVYATGKVAHTFLRIKTKK